MRKFAGGLIVGILSCLLLGAAPRYHHSLYPIQKNGDSAGIGTSDPDTTFEISGSLSVGDGDADTNYVEIDATGDVTFVGSSGLVFGELNVNDNTDTTTFAGTGIANKVQYVEFDTDGESNNTTPSHGDDHIAINITGKYLVTISITANSSGAGARTISFDVFKNNGDTALVHLHAHRTLAGGGGETGSISLSGIADLTAADTVELWIHNETNTNAIIVEDVTMSLVQIGG